MQILFSIDFYRYLTFVGAKTAMWVNFLVKQNYVKGNINQVLCEMDNVLFRRMTSFNNQQMLNCEFAGFLYIFYYLFLRLEQLKINTNNRFLMEELTIKAFNDVYSSINSSFFDEPVLFNLDYKLPPFLFILSKIFYNYRIDEVIKEIAGIIQSRFPALHANRLYLLWGLVRLKQVTGFKFWDEQINIIYNNIDISRIIENELRNKQVFIKDGVAGIYLLLKDLENTEYKLFYNPKILIRRIYSSDIWNEIAKQPLTFVDGLSGLLWIIYQIKKNYFFYEN